MQNQSLFGHIVARFSDQQENLATESLHYILQEAPAARHAFFRYVAQLGPQFDAGMRLETQTGKDRSARPDMVGRGADGQPVLVIEAKFWAGLTDQQPVAYIKALPEDRDAILLFVAPEKRFVTLWPELVRRCREAGLEIASEVPGGSAWRAAGWTRDAAAFLPLSSEELTAGTGTRITQYCSLVDDITKSLVEEKIASIKGLNVANAHSGRY